MNFSNSTTDKTESLIDTKSLTNQWESIDWLKVEHDVNRLQTRIAKATANGDSNKAKRLQYLLTHSYFAKAYAVRKVTTNKGKNTSGVDKRLWSTSASKMKAVLSLTDKCYRAKPLKRVYIAKKGKNKKRPLGIPTMYDRAMQTLYALALEPIAETKADTISFGFRRGRSAKDACEQIFCVLARKCSPTWILEGDIKGCFDNINHEWLQSNIPTDKRIMKQFLKSGFIYEGKLFPTETGSPQGGAISSLYANMTLDGLEEIIQDKYHRNSKGNIENHYRAKTKVNLVRYADDFIITANSKENAEELKRIVSTFLESRGLMLSEEKLREGKASTQSDLIRRLNQVIRGWTNYHKHVVASQAFSYVNNTLYHLLHLWAKHRHPNKNKWWRLNRYWHTKNGKPWVSHFFSLAYVRDFCLVHLHSLTLSLFAGNRIYRGCVCGFP